jgi:murein L,D-transpeptidase YcbB/YkuD
MVRLLPLGLRAPSSLLAIGALLLCLAGGPALAEGTAAALPSAQGQTAAQIAARLADAAPLSVEGIALDRAPLAAVYGARQNAPLWEGRADWPAALEVALAASASEGIPPESLGLTALRRALADPALNPAERDLFLTDRFFAYGAILARGRIDLASIETLWALPAPVFDPVTAVAGLEKSGGPAAALQVLAPASADYDRLRTALARYETLAAAGGWESLPPGTKLRAGDQGPMVQLLRRRLAAEADLPADLTENPAFDAGLEAAVKGFQGRHGMLEDGRIGPATLAALNLTAADRARQIRVNLERLRASPHALPPTRIEVQQASQMLTLYRDGKPVLVSRVVVGAPIHATPVLEAAVERVVLDPAWDVPPSIVRNEIQPRLGRDPGYLARNHYVVLGSGPGGMRLRQLPGPWNALGTVMLDMPNPFDVYLHDTPLRSLFALPQRALSHGCVRVEAVRDLAGALLGAPLPAPGGPTRGLKLAAPMPVYFLYQTAFAEADGTVAFRDDIYGRDARLVAALARIEGGAVPPPPPVVGATVPASAKSCPQIAANLDSLAP